jgi:hypothetical protein
MGPTGGPEVALVKHRALRPHRSRPPGLLLVFTGFSALLAASWAVYATLWFLDFGGRSVPVGLLALWSSPRAADVLSGIGEVTIAVLAIALTVVAILVELASSRFTARIAPLFIRDPLNALALGGFVVTVVLVLWVDMSLYGPDYPETMVLVATGAVSLTILGLLPYFGYLFGFFSPGNVIGRVERQAERAIRKLARSGASVDRRREKVIGSVEHLADMILIAIKNDESALAVPAIEALSEIACSGLRMKRYLPAAWFEVESLAETDRDFVTLDPEMVSSLTERRTWLEAKILRGCQTAFFRGLPGAPDLNHLIAIHTRRIARASLEIGDRSALRLALRFLNTYLSRSITVGDVRSAHNALAELRWLACEDLLEQGEFELVKELADWLQHYARVSFELGRTFVTEAVAHDLADTIIRAHAAGAPNHDALLDILLQVDREPGGLTGQESALRGVRKAQVKLATHYLTRGDTERAHRIYEDMRYESRERLRTIHLELAELEEREWSEITNRDANWDYLSEAQKKELPVFFGWFREETLTEVPERADRLEPRLGSAIGQASRLELGDARGDLQNSRTGGREAR